MTLNNINVKPVAIVLGGTNPHKGLIKKLKLRGYYTLLIDYLPNPPAASESDEHIQESTLDTEKVLKICQERKANLVIASCVDQANITASFVSEKLDLPRPYSSKLASMIGNKISMKQKMYHHGIPTANFVTVKKGEKANIKDLEFPLVVKPSDTNGSKGVRKVENVNELNIALPVAVELSREKEAIIERFIEGDEIGIDCFIDHQEAHVLSTHKKRKPFLKDGSVIFSIGSISPPPLTVSQNAQIAEVANKIANAFGFKNTPLLIQAIINEDEINVVEFAPRIGGGLNFRKIELFTGFDILNASIDSFLNLPVTVKTRKPDFYYSENHLYTCEGIFGEIIGFEALVESGVVEEFYLNKTKGSKIFPGNASKDRAGSYIVKGATIGEIKEKIKLVMQHVVVIDINGQKLDYSYDYSNLIL
jgi:biotin carboxylase